MVLEVQGVLLYHTRHRFHLFHLSLPSLLEIHVALEVQVHLVHQVALADIDLFHLLHLEDLVGRATRVGLGNHLFQEVQV